MQLNCHPDLGVDVHVADAEDEAAVAVRKRIVDGAPSAADDHHVGLVELLVVIQDYPAL